jgi:hypothetical protein
MNLWAIGIPRILIIEFFAGKKRHKSEEVSRTALEDSLVRDVAARRAFGKLELAQLA